MIRVGTNRLVKKKLTIAASKTGSEYHQRVFRDNLKLHFENEVLEIQGQSIVLKEQW